MWSPLIISLIVGLIIAFICSLIYSLYNYFKIENYVTQLKTADENLSMYRRLYDNALENNQQLLGLAKDKEGLEHQILAATQQYKNLSSDYNRLEENMKQKRKNYDDLEEKYIQKTNDILLLENQKDELKSIISQTQDVNREIVNKGNELAARLAALQSTHRAVMKEVAMSEHGEENYGWGMSLSVAENKILETVDELTKLCPELASDLAAIKWKRIWLPKIQALAGQEALDGRSGIYKLTLKSNTQICYVGQAVNIKERWYTHIKKMLGVESKGKERLYNNDYTPDDFYWGVVEFVDDKSELNEKEKYWIDYYSCTEYGLNSKRG